MKVKFLLGATLVSLVLVGCGESSRKAGNNVQVEQKVEVDETLQNMSLNLEKMPESLDPQFNSEGEGSLVINNLYEGLMRELGENLVNGIADSYTVSEDKLTYTFKLREAYWSDGTEITAEDFVYAWRRGADPVNKSPHLKHYESAKIKNAGAIARGEMSTASLGVLALDTHVLEVVLEEPNANFLEYMTLESFMPVREDMVDEAGTWSKTNASYNGPFKLVTCNKQGLILEKNEYYWNAKDVKLQSVNMQIIGDAEIAESKYLNNELDILILKNNGDGKMTEESQETDTPNELKEKEESILVHSWVSGWRTNLQGLLWFGNTYIEAH